MEKIVAWLKEHPYMAGGGVLAVIVLWYLYSQSQASSAADVSSGIDPTTAALYNAQLQAQTQEQEQGAQISGQLDLAQLQAQTAQQSNLLTAQTQQQANTLGAGVSLAGINAQQNLGEAQIAEQIQASNNDLTATTAALQTQLQGLESNNATTEQIAQDTAAEQLGIANITGQTQVAISNNQTQVGIAQTNAAVQMQKIQANTQTTGGILGVIGGVLGSIL